MLLNIFFIICVNVLPKGMSGNYMCVWYLVNWHKIGYIVTVQLMASESNFIPSFTSEPGKN